MKALAVRHHGLRGVLDPRIEVRAGPFRAHVIDMLHAGWEFQRSENTARFDERILARNPNNGLVGMAFIDPMFLYRGGEARIPPYLYFNQDIILSMEFYRRLEAPRMQMHDMDVGQPAPLGMNQGVEMEIYEANVDKEDKPQELIVLPEDIPMLMDKIIQAQEPRAKEILADQRKQEGLGELQMKAKILTFGKSA